MGLMPKLIDLKGKTFGSWFVIKRAANKGKKTMWTCRCGLCGKVSDVSSWSLLDGSSKSCGCNHPQEFGELMRKHGLINTRLYSIWKGMKARCYGTGRCTKNYKNKGITVCEEWKFDFKKFYDWAMTHGYADNLTIDRIDNSKGYYPENCRWATALEQGFNTSRTHKVLDESTGKYYSCNQLAKLLKIPSSTVARDWRVSNDKTLQALILTRLESYKKHNSRITPLEKTNIIKYFGGIYGNN